MPNEEGTNQKVGSDLKPNTTSLFYRIDNQRS